jgi:hypothetical protein
MVWLFFWLESGMAETPNYHINLWPEPPGSPSTYLCLVPDCAYANASQAQILAHEMEVHGLEPLPTPIAASSSLLPTLLHGSASMPPGPTYRTETAEGAAPVYHCLQCEATGSEHHTHDLALLKMHLEQRHDGRMQEATEADVSATAQPEGGPPGQSGQHPEHPHGGPPGQTGQHPDNEPTPHPEHPIVEPDDEPEKV